jgi:AcrR family transcriptional regulator
MIRNKAMHHESILRAAAEEFRTYGFADASIRRIAKASGMSAPGMYKHFAGKEDLFAALVEPAVSGFWSLYDTLAEEEYAAIDAAKRGEEAQNVSSTERMLKYIYSNYDAFKLVICCSEGTKYAGFVHEAAQMEEKNTKAYFAQAKANGFEVKELPEKEIHLLVTANVNAVVSAIEHDFTLEEAMHYAKTLEIFFASGWHAVLGI